MDPHSAVSSMDWSTTSTTELRSILLRRRCLFNSKSRETKVKIKLVPFCAEGARPFNSLICLLTGSRSDYKPRRFLLLFLLGKTI